MIFRKTPHLLILLLSPFFAYAENYIGVQTELIFDSKKISYLPFSPCPLDQNSSCATIEKAEEQGSVFKSKKICTFKVKNENVSKLEITGTRILTVKEVSRNSSGEVISLLLTGAKAPIHLSCDTEITKGGIANRMFNFPLSVEVLKNFKEFDLGTTIYDEANQEKSNLSPARAKPESKSPGKAI